MIRPTSLTEFAESYVADRFDLSEGYRAELLRAVKQLNEWAGYDLPLGDLSVRLVSDFLRSRIANSSPVTVNNKRRELLTLWNAAAEAGLVLSPGTIRRLQEPLDPPSAWTVEEVRTLVEQCQQEQGYIAGISAGLWWATFVMAIYWTGTRPSALLQVRPEDLHGDGLLIRGASQKNRRGQWHPLPLSFLGELRQMGGGPERLWPWPYHRNTLFASFRRIVEKAKIPLPLGGRQLFYRLRRTHLSYCAAADPLLAQRQAGHADYRTTERHYIDPRIARQRTAADVLPMLNVPRE